MVELSKAESKINSIWSGLSKNLVSGWAEFRVVHLNPSCTSLLWSQRVLKYLFLLLPPKGRIKIIYGGISQYALFICVAIQSLWCKNASWVNHLPFPWGNPSSKTANSPVPWSLLLLHSCNPHQGCSDLLQHIFSGTVVLELWWKGTTGRLWAPR